MLSMKYFPLWQCLWDKSEDMFPSHVFIYYAPGPKTYVLIHIKQENVTIISKVKYEAM